MIEAQPTVSQQETIADSFDSGGFDGNDGSINWTGPWTQMLGVILYSDPDWCASGKCLRLTSAFFGLVSSSRGADLSAFSSGAISFDYRAFCDPATGEADAVVVSNGTTYTLGSLSPTVEGQLGSAHYNIPVTYLTSDFRIQFQGNADGQGAFTDVIIDNVILAVQTNETASSTAPAAPTNTLPTPYPTLNATNHSASHPTTSPVLHPTGSSPTPPTSNNSTLSSTQFPTRYPTRHPTGPPPTTTLPTLTIHSNFRPTPFPTRYPTQTPTRGPQSAPTLLPTRRPTQRPTQTPTSGPQTGPTLPPTRLPTQRQTRLPTRHPTLLPSQHKPPRKTRPPTQHKPAPKKLPQKKPPQKKPPQKKPPTKKTPPP